MIEEHETGTTAKQQPSSSAFERIQEDTLRIQHELEHLRHQLNRGWTVRLDMYGFTYCVMMVTMSIFIVLGFFFVLVLGLSYLAV